MTTIHPGTSPVTGTSTTLTATVSGQQPSAPTYTWTVLDGPAASTTSFSNNGTLNANPTTVTFNRAGGYLIQVSISDGGTPFDTATVEIQVTQTYTILATSPGSVVVALPTKVGFTSTALDQFLHALFTQPTGVVWSVIAGGGTIDSTNGFYTPPGVAGNATVQASFGGKTRTSAVTINTGNYPTVATPAAASPTSVTGLTTALTVLGASTSGESNLTYTWSGGALFTDSGTNGAKSTTAIFPSAGPYTLVCTITDKNGLTTTSSVNVTVSQTATSISISPSTVNLQGGANQQFQASELDQFGFAMSSQPSFTWTVTSGGGSVNSGGLFTAPSTQGTSIIQAMASGPIMGTAVANVTSTPGFTFDAGTGTLTITANDFQNNVLCQLYTPSGQATLLLSNLTSTNQAGQTTVNKSDQRAASTVNTIDYHGETGLSTSFQNITNIPCSARGGSGTNLLVGGDANDFLYAGTSANSNNTLKGEGGSDNTLTGGLGTNYLYGGTSPGANNTIITNPNAVANYVFPNG